MHLLLGSNGDGGDGDDGSVSRVLAQHPYGTLVETYTN